AVELQPDFCEAWTNLGAALQHLHRTDQAIDATRHAISLNSEYALAHLNLGQLLFVRGEYEAAWPEHEWRWGVPKPGSQPRNFPQPQWDGSPLDGRTLLIHAEQALGDTLQFARYIPFAA